MPGPWEQYAAAPTPAADGPWANYAPAPAPAKPAYTSAILPFSKDAQGKVSFDSNAGILGSVKRAFTLPGEVASGEIPITGPDGRTNPQVIDRAAELAAVAAPTNPAVAVGDRAVPGALKALTREKVEAPTAEALKDAATAGYDKARGMGVDVRGSAIGDMARGIQSSLEQDGVIAELAPKTFSILSKITKPPDGAIATLANIEAVRRALGHAANDFTNRTEQMAAKRAIGRLDDFVAEMPAESVLAGPAAAAGKTLREARDNYAAAMRSNRITGELDDAVTGAVERGNLNAAVANSGQNLDNAIRQRMRSLLTSKKEVAGYTPEELKAIEATARGGVGTNAARFAGNLLGGGGGMAAALPGVIGGAAAIGTGNPLVAALAAAPVAGIGFKKLANTLTTKAANRADELIRKRSPLYEEAERNAPVVADSAAKRAALIRALLLAEQPQQ